MFKVSPHLSSQRYCSARECQNERRRKWRRQKLRSDPDYKANQADSQRRWCRKNPDYWRRYRDGHPDYVERNRQLQQMRNGRRIPERSRESIAKRYALSMKNDGISGYYRLIRADAPMIAKIDASLVKIEFISGSCADFYANASHCKEIT